MSFEGNNDEAREGYRESDGGFVVRNREVALSEWGVRGGF